MQYLFTHRGITYTVDVNARPGRRMHWQWQAANGLSGKCSTFATSIDNALFHAKRDAEVAIDREVDG